MKGGGLPFCGGSCGDPVVEKRETVATLNLTPPQKKTYTPTKKEAQKKAKQNNNWSKR
eukprot:NODE_4208_length_599_cov_221.894545_g3039_i0.p2 GENE.NODE_4208_length_599_cov_221.894545_g3039_i0~~NODE_4208_length_599_cov_221.894545_g3039_i0.p2  ORF type:complete len:58 (+),score=2.41 NODE_4208_length_599_cov_221.894545_g3039_i0:387-560(+)